MVGLEVEKPSKNASPLALLIAMQRAPQAADESAPVRGFSAAAARHGQRNVHLQADAPQMPTTGAGDGRLYRVLHLSRGRFCCATPCHSPHSLLLANLSVTGELPPTPTTTPLSMPMFSGQTRRPIYFLFSRLLGAPLVFVADLDTVALLLILLTSRLVN